MMNNAKKMLLGLSLLVSSQVQAETINMKVNGLVCSFCAQGLEKTFKEIPGVGDVYVSLEKKLVAVDLKSGQNISDDQLKSAITKSGYTLVSVERSDVSVAELKSKSK